MKQISRLFIVFVALLGSLAQAAVVQIKEMREILPHITKTTWVVFDLDNTIMETRQSLGSDQWFDYQVKKSGSLEDSIRLWENIQAHTVMQLVERETPRLVRGIQNRGIKVFALTARPSSMREITEDQLSGLGVHFEKIVSLVPEQSKGQAMLIELANADVRPSKIIFVDDKQKHATSVDAALSESGLSHLEFRYGAADAKVHSFDARIAEVQLKFFRKQGLLLTDREAADYLRID